MNGGDSERRALRGPNTPHVEPEAPTAAVGTQARTIVAQVVTIRSNARRSRPPDPAPCIVEGPTAVVPAGNWAKSSG